MRKFNSEQLLLSRVLIDSDLTTAVDLGLSSRYLHTPGAADAWDWIAAYRSQYNEVPSIDAFRRKYPVFPVDLSVEEPLRALVDEVFANYKKRIVGEGLQEAVSMFDETNDPDEVLPVIQSFLSTVNRDTVRSDIVLASDVVGKLVVQYVNAEENSMPGIPTGFKIIDEALGGLQDEQLITLVGLPKSMKSSYLLYMAMQAMYNGYRAGLVSFEMSNAEQHARWLSLGAQVPLTRMVRGQLNDIEIARLQAYEAEITETPGLGEMVFIHDVNNSDSVDGLISKHEQHGFDVLYVDGVYLMNDSLGETKGSSQALTNITRGLKRFAQVAKIPIGCTTQALGSRTSRARGIQMESIAYTSSFAQDSDAILGVDRPDLNIPVAKLKVIAARNALGVETEVAIDYTTGRVSDRGIVTDGPTGIPAYGGDDDV